MKTLYKKDSKGKIRIWTIETDFEDLIECSGFVDGKLVPHIKTCKGKNIGKSNETSPEEQAILEMNSRYLSKLDEGYFKTIKEAETNEVLLPMLAKNYADYEAKIDWSNCYIQPKLDGMRCLAKLSKDGNVQLISRDGKSIDQAILAHIVSELCTIQEDIILDGELYCHGLSFQENMKLIKKYRPGETEKVKFHVYDTVSDLPFSRRSALVNLLLVDFKTVDLVLTYPLAKEDLGEMHTNNLKNGYEGSIIRWGNAPYKIDGRSENLLKYKDFQDIACKIIDVEPAEQRPEWGVPVLEHNGKVFRAGTKMSHEERIDLLANKHEYIEEIAEIRFFEYTDDGLPRFPVMVGIRLDK